MTWPMLRQIADDIDRAVQRGELTDQEARRELAWAEADAWSEWNDDRNNY